MTVSRYKIMAGILGVSIGGLAVAAQCPRPGSTQRSADTPAGEPKVPAAGAKPAPLPALPTPSPDAPPPPAVSPVSADLPALPIPTGAPPAKLPELPVVTPVRADLPKPAALPTPVVIPAAGTSLPDVPPAVPALPATPEKTPAVVPPAPPKAAPPMTPPAPPKAVEPVTPPPAPVAEPVSLTPAAPTTVVTPPAPPAAVVPTPAVEPARPTPAVEPARPTPAPAVQQAAAAANRFRILLRVGEGEPMFEVKSGDDLVLRVVCEKVDVKSPEKGQGPSSVTATGRVRFVGFGAEGTCDNLSFLAGTGEVSLTGGVRVQVKDRIGRVESELSSDRLQYRLDANALPGTLRP